MRPTAGDATVLLREVRAQLDIDWTKAKVVNENDVTMNDYLKSRGDDFVRDWPKDQKKIKQYFMAQFNRQCDHMDIDLDTRHPDYTIVVHIDEIDTGEGGSMFNPWAGAKAGGVILTGSIDIVDAATGEVTAAFAFTEIKGTSYVSETIRIGLAFGEVGNELGKYADEIDD